jgi:drug/metabolite transporter (DMT)-like permease
MTRTERQGLSFVALSVIFISTSPVLVAWASPMPSLIKTEGRLLVAAFAVVLLSRLLPAAAVDPHAVTQQRPWRASARRFALYGLVTALHFYFYIAALDYTTAAHALAIVYTAPVFVTLLSAAALHEAVRRRQWIGVGITVIGIAILAGLEPTMTQRMLFGDCLALLSAVMYAFYSIAGRYERGRYPLLVYTSRVYLLGALWLLPAALLVAPVLGLRPIQAPRGSWGWQQIAAVVALGIIPHALGHTLYHASLRRVHATYVNIIASQEVTGGIILAFVLLGQVPSLNSLVGAAVTLVGIALVLL